MNAAFNLSRVTPRRGEVFLVVAVSVLVLVMDLASTTLGDTMKPTMWFSLVLAGLAVTSCFWPVLAGSAVVILSAVAAVLPEDVVTVVNGPLLVMLVVGMWTSRRWYAMAGAVVVMEGVLPYLNGYRADVALMSAAATGLVGGLGGEVAGHLWRRAEGLAVELDAVARQRDLAEARVRADLSEALHDTVCRDLTMLISQCREVAADNDLEIRDGVSRIEGRARDALAHLREVSAVLSVEGRPELRDMALEDVLAECALMLEHRDMTIDAQLGAWDGGEDDDSRDAAFVLGLVVGLGLAALRSALDTRIANPKDLAHLTDVPTLGAILDDPRADKHALVVHSNPRSPRSESFRSLRTNLQFVNVDGNPRSFVVTSSAPNEGKTTVSTNLAISLAQTGASVVLVDADLRKPSVAKVMGVDGSIGLSSVLAGLVELEDVLTPWVGGGLHVVPAGRIPPNPSELLGSVEMANLLSRLTDRFDHVIIDTPPVLAVTDAALLSRLAGGTILVAAVGLARRNDVVAALDALDGIARRLSGIVVTRAPSKGPDAYHYARYVYVDDDAARLGTDSLAWLEDGTERQRRRVR